MMPQHFPVYVIYGEWPDRQIGLVIGWSAELAPVIVPLRGMYVPLNAQALDTEVSREFHSDLAVAEEAMESLDRDSAVDDRNEHPEQYRFAK